MKRILAAALLCAATVAAATCPFNIPVVTVPPQQVAGFVWGPAIQPMGDACVTSIAVDPANDLKWYVGGANGLYVTNDGGQTWKHPARSVTLPHCCSFRGTPRSFTWASILGSTSRAIRARTGTTSETIRCRSARST